MSIYIDEFEKMYSKLSNIEGLRSKVRNLAISGKLSEQLHGEDINVLLQDIKNQRDKLLEDKIIKKNKKLVPISDESDYFEIPANWRWLKLGEIGICQTGTTPSTKKLEYYNGEIPFIKPGDISNRKIIYDNESLTEIGLEVGRKINEKSNLMVCIGGSTGKTFYTDRMVSCNQQINTITPFEGVNYKYIHIVLDSNYFYQVVWDNATGSATPIINRSDWENVPVPLPPSDEQNRIVNKYMSIMTKIDVLEENLKQKESILNKLPQAVVDAIGYCETGEELREQLEFVISNFETIFQTPESMQELRNVILQLAIEGKLVSQDESDEPASELIKRIQEEREQLVKDKKIKKPKKLPEIEEDEIPFEIPESWEWVRLNEISEINPRNQIDDELKVAFIPMKLMSDGYGSHHESEEKKWKDLKKGYTHFAEDDIAIAKITPCFENRKSAILSNLKSGYGAGTTEFHIVRVYSENIKREYLLNIFKTQWFIDSGVSTFSGTAGQQRISTDFIKEYFVPIPPLEEQQRILVQLNSLMNVIDGMENKLKRKAELVKRLGEV